jgi:hypothetical protein
MYSDRGNACTHLLIISSTFQLSHEWNSSRRRERAIALRSISSNAAPFFLFDLAAASAAMTVFCTPIPASVADKSLTTPLGGSPSVGL